MSSWPILPLGKAGVRLIDCVHKTPEARTEGYPYVAIPQMKGGHIDFSDARRISAADLAEWTKKAKPQPHDIILSRRTNPGVIAVDKTNTPFALGQNLVLLRADGKSVYPPFLRWLCLSPAWWEQIDKFINVGAVFSSLRCGDVPNFELPIPPLPEQREIAAILGALDDKIEVNRKAASVLEEMARALYRSWFVSFDPVQAKSERRPPMLTPSTPLPAPTAALFPDSFGEDGLPEGWREVQLADFYDVLETGRRPKGGVKEIDEGVPSIGAESVKGIGIFDYSKTKRIPRDFFDAMRKGRLADGDILIYKDGGKPGELRPAVTYVSRGFPFDEACINEHVFRVRLKPEIGQHFGFLSMSSESCMDQMRERATGVAQPGLNQSAMNSLTFVRPDKAGILSTFNAMVQPFLDGCNEKAKESQTLAALRDSLLPRLMSGELRVGEARERVEEVA